MQRLKVIVYPPASEPRHRELAVGMQGIWACALHTCGANVFAPLHLLEPDEDPFTALVGRRGSSLMHDAAPLDPSIDVVVVAELGCGTHGWRCRARILRPDGSEVVLPGRSHGGLSGVLGAMTSTVHSIGDALGIALPQGIGWRQLARARTVAGAIEGLRNRGRQTLQRMGLEPCAMVH